MSAHPDCLCISLSCHWRVGPISTVFSKTNVTLMYLVTTAEEKVHMEYVVNPYKPLKQRVCLFQNSFFCTENAPWGMADRLRQQMLDREMDTR